MKTLKTLLLFVLSALSLSAWAQTIHIYSIARGVTVNDTKYAGPLYSDGSQVLANEKVAVIIAQHKSEAKKDATVNSLFEVDKAGQILLTSDGKDAISSFEVFSKPLNNNGTIGSPTKLDETFYPDNSYLWEISSTVENPSVCRVVYFLRFDSRYYDPKTDTLCAGAYSQSWGGVKLAHFITSSGPSLGGNFRQFLLDIGYTTTAYTLIENPQLEWTATSVESMTIGEKEYTGEALKQELKPTVSMIQPDADGTFVLDCGSTDLVSYTLETTDTLNDSTSWVPMDEFIKNLSEDEKNTLATQSEKCYTYLRVKDSTQIKIPRLSKDTKRFYRLIAE